MQKYAVMGNPIEHSKSPLIHKAFAQQFHIELTYEKILVPLGGLADAVWAFREKGGCGINITLPLKMEAYQLVSEHTARTEHIKCVNTIIFKENKIVGDSTDGIGLLRDFSHHQIRLKNKRIIILGAGGAARSILVSLLAEHPASLVIANRTKDKADQLIAEFSSMGNLSSASFQDLQEQTFDLIINATSAGAKGEKLHLPLCLTNNPVCYDLSYGAIAQDFLAWIKSRGAGLCLEGYGMLVEQAAESFYLWHGKRPDTQPVIKMLLQARHNNGEISS